MSSTIRYETIYKRVVLTVLAVSALSVIILGYSFAKFSRTDTGEEGAAAPSPEWPKATVFGGIDLSLFQPGTAGGIQTAAGDLAERFRLAGTFFWSSADDDSDITRKAIIDSLTEKTEHIVVEGDVVDGVTVVSIYNESVILRDGKHEEELTLSYAGSAQPDAASTAPGDWLKLTDREKNDVSATNQFGAKVGENRWVMSRGRLEDYALEIEDRPSRMIPLFDSMKPIYSTSDNGSRRIDGYKLEMEGEGDFYSAVGLKEGDEVLKVNMMPMTNKRRAMFWINQFREGKVNTFMLDIIRDGEPVRLEYLMR